MNEFPPMRDVGTDGQWSFQDRQERVAVVKGQFLGMGTTHRPPHQDSPHGADGYALKGSTCSTCRWVEVRIFYDPISESYVLLTVGRSVVPGEVDLVSFERAYSGFEVVERMTTKRRNRDTGQREAYLANHVRAALSQAAEFDTSMRNAWTARRAYE